ncbi:tRNA pseudouridine synthase A [Pirellulimonas nuda]|uniref:tRNA pseudouridine synthase A n=1 Tax=Pirellulimonas nuda TaxID=2528009 RepID=A0A518DA40_9BACT|nr:tRNA pseudouridine(38-40) synthase TruA [Pirellulimonas nuda]QDU88350.1 tRNA pseudouridine synthase A [Pirellulimonas nuda]
MDDVSRPSAFRFLKLTIGYDGTAFAGWQEQPGLRTVQNELASAWRRITGETPRLTASGRTDAGVHALGQVVSLCTSSERPEGELARGLNAVLPEDIVVLAIDPAVQGFHATHDALSKTYRYQIHDSRTPPLFDRRYVWHVRQPLDIERMGRAGGGLIGRHDFVSFQTAGSQRTSTVRTILAVEVTRLASRVDITVTGDGFLYNMVRAIAGTLVEVGRGARDPEWVAEALSARDRAAAGPNAPALGLVLVSVRYAQGSDE